VLGQEDALVAKEAALQLNGKAGKRLSKVPLPKRLVTYSSPSDISTVVVSSSLLFMCR
jgi:hypothetical protein